MQDVHSSSTACRGRLYMRRQCCSGHFTAAAASQPQTWIAQRGLAFTCMRALTPCNGPVPCSPRPRLSTRLPCCQLAAITHGALGTEACRIVTQHAIAEGLTLPVCLYHGASLCIFKGLLESALQAPTGGARLEPVSCLAMLFHLSCQTAASRRKHLWQPRMRNLDMSTTDVNYRHPAHQQAYQSISSRLSPMTAITWI